MHVTRRISKMWVTAIKVALLRVEITPCLSGCSFQTVLHSSLSVWTLGE